MTQRARFLPLRLAIADYLHEWSLSACLTAGLAAVLAPLLVLLGLKTGVIDVMSSEIARFPSSRELRLRNSIPVDAELIAAIKSMQQTDFLLGTNRTVSTSVYFVRIGPNGERGEALDLTPSVEGDPLLSADAYADAPISPPGKGEVVLSFPAAAAIGATPGDALTARIGRQASTGERQEEERQMRVAAILPGQVESRVFALASPEFIQAVETYRETPAIASFADAEAAISNLQAQNSPQTFSGFRLYAKSIYDVEPLQKALESRGLVVASRLSEILLLTRLDFGLNLLFVVLATLGGLGFLFSLGASLWGNVARKRRELSLLRLMGFSPAAIAATPATQSLMTAVLGFVVAFVVFILTSSVIPGLFSGSAIALNIAPKLSAAQIFMALGITIGAALAASAFASLAAMRISPAEGIRYE